MYFRDSTATISSVSQHQLWVALEAGSGIISEHDYDPNSECRTTGPNPFNGCSSDSGAWWNVTNDPFVEGEAESMLWAFTRHRALNRLALRTKLNISGSNVGLISAPEDNYTEYLAQNCYNDHGGIEIGQLHDGVSSTQCKQLCDADSNCDCVVVSKWNQCWKRTQCKPSQFENDSATAPFTVFVKKNWTPPPPPPKVTAINIFIFK